MQEKNSTFHSHLPAMIRSLRIQNGLSQVEFARELKVTPGAVCNWEKGVSPPSAKNLALVARAFGVSLELLWNGATTDAAGISAGIPAASQIPYPPVRHDGMKLKRKKTALLKLLRKVEGIAKGM
jgi:transcriptional regulator with XRE-family HTH domain